MSFGAQLGAVAACEFRMQVRRLGFWLSAAAIIFLVLYEVFPNPYNLRRLQFLTDHRFAAERIVETGCELFALAVAFLVGDRILRDARLRTAEMLLSTPVSVDAYALGKYLGNLGAAILMPVALVLLGALEQWAFNPARFGAWPYLQSFVLLALPTMLFVTGVSLLLPQLLRSVRLFYVVFLVYVLNSLGFFRTEQQFGFYELIAAAGRLVFTVPGWPTPYQSAFLNIGFLLGVGIGSGLLLLPALRRTWFL